jgi:hypothetical protein
MHSWCYQTISTTQRCSLGATKPPPQPEDGNGVSSRNVGKLSHPDAAVCQRKFHGKAPRSFETSRTTYPSKQFHKLDALQPAITASLTSKHDSHEKYISDSANIKDTEK